MIYFPEDDSRFRKSTYSDGGDECIEVADLSACDCHVPAPSGRSVHAVRDTTQRHLGALLFGGTEWSGFVATARR